MSPGSQVGYLGCDGPTVQPRNARYPWEVRYHILTGGRFKERTLCGHKWCHAWRTIYADNRAPTCGKCKALTNR